MATHKPTVLRFGNDHPMHMHDGEETRRRADHLSQAVTSVAFPTVDPEHPDNGPLDPDHVERALSTRNEEMLWMIGKSLTPAKRKYAIAIHQMNDIIAVHANGVLPAWISCPDDPDLEKALADYYECPRGEPVALLPNAGRDYLHTQFLTTAYMAFTASTVAAASGDTTLTGEITTGGGGLIRGVATFAHTSGTNTSTETRTATANGSDSLPVTLVQDGILSASSAGTLMFHTALSSTATLSVSGDSITNTHTPTIG